MSDEDKIDYEETRTMVQAVWPREDARRERRAASAGHKRTDDAQADESVGEQPALETGKIQDWLIEAAHIFGGKEFTGSAAVHRMVILNEASAIR